MKSNAWHSHMNLPGGRRTVSGGQELIHRHEKDGQVSPGQAEKRHRADFGECQLLEVELPFIPDACPSLEARLSLLHIYFSDRLPGARNGLCDLRSCAVA